MQDVKYMRQAIKEAEKSLQKDEVPVGCILVKDNKILARAHNLRESKQLATAHAELLCIEKACKKLKSWRLVGCTLYVTLEPCPMCAGAIINARIDRVVFGASDKKAGYVSTLHQTLSDPALNHRAEILGGIEEEHCGKLLSDYFKEKREKKKV